MRNSKLKTRNCFLQPPASSLQSAFTLVEVLIVVAILAVVAAGLVGLSSYLQTQNNIVLTEKCVELLSTAVAEFHDITGHYPIDKNDWGNRDTLPGCRLAGATCVAGNDPDPDELLYLQLSLFEDTRQIIANLPGKLLAAPHDGITVQLAHDLSADTPYLRSIVDAWGNALDYDASVSFPKIWSYGPDGIDGTVDDISNED